MDAEKYLERIENTRLNITPLYSRKEMIFFAKNYAEHYHTEQLKLCEVNRSLPTHKEVLSKMNYLVKENYSKNTEIEKANFRIGWQECFSWLAQNQSDNG